MTYRDPLYDPEIRPEGSTLDEQIEQAVSGGSSLGEPFPGGADTMSSDEGSQQGGGGINELRDKGQDVAGQAMEKGSEAMDMAKSKVSGLTDQAQEKTDLGLEKASSGLSGAADMLRQQGEKQEGQVGTIATTAAEKLDAASGYLSGRSSDQLVSDLEDLVRRKPTESLLVAAGIGLLLSRIFS